MRAHTIRSAVRFGMMTAVFAGATLAASAAHADVTNPSAGGPANSSTGSAALKFDYAKGLDTNITTALVQKLLIFDYATIYRSKHNSIGDPALFRLSDADFNDFTAFLSTKKYTYSSGTEKLITGVEEEAKKEKAQV